MHRNPGKNPYQHRRGEEREMRSPDNSAEKINRLDRVEEKNVTVEISSKLAKRLERDEHDRFDMKTRKIWLLMKIERKRKEIG